VGISIEADTEEKAYPE